MYGEPHKRDSLMVNDGAQRVLRSINRPIGDRFATPQVRAFSKNVLQVVTGLSHAFNEAMELLSAFKIEFITSVAFEAGDHGLHEFEKLV